MLRQTFILFIILGLTLFSHLVIGQNNTQVFVLEIRNEIDPRMSRYVDLALEEATAMKADLVLIDMDTYGGTLDDADKIRTKILKFPKPIHVFINNNAASAGALISISADSIYMAPGGNIGAATVVFGDGQPAPDKYQSFMRSKMRSTAEEKGRNPEKAAGMVGQPIGKDSFSVGNVISYTTAEAIENGFCEGKVNSLEQILESKLQIKNYQITRFELSQTEQIINIFLNPYLQSILLLVLLGGLYFELQTPGVGFPLLASIIAATLYFLPNYLNGLAEYWEILLFIAGIILIMLEILVIPGFGIAGISGIIFFSAGLVLVLLNNNALDFTFVPAHSIVNSFLILLVALSGAVIVIFAGGAKFIESKAFKRISLQETMDTKEGWTSNFNQKDLINKQGIVWSVLRPSGKVLIDDIIYDATSRGEYIEKGKEIQVIEQTGTWIKVKELV
jgi:membrane-bound serine protease (ClpP class)